jgi:hypothetical protein
MDSSLRALSQHQGLPFKDSPPPDLFVSIFRQLWGGVDGGEVDSDKVSDNVSVKIPTCAGIEGDEEAISVDEPAITVGEPAEKEEWVTVGEPSDKEEEEEERINMVDF